MQIASVGHYLSDQTHNTCSSKQDLSYEHKQKCAEAIDTQDSLVPAVYIHTVSLEIQMNGSLCEEDRFKLTFHYKHLTTFMQIVAHLSKSKL